MEPHRIFALLVVTFASVAFVSSVGTCKDFAYDECQEVKDSTIEAIHNVTVEDCQFFCSTIYKDACKYFYHDNKQNLCSLLSTDGDELWQSCNKFSGPKEPKVDACITEGAEHTPCWVSFVFAHTPATLLTHASTMSRDVPDIHGD